MHTQVHNPRPGVEIALRLIRQDHESDRYMVRQTQPRTINGLLTIFLDEDGGYDGYDYMGDEVSDEATEEEVQQFLDCLAHKYE